MSWLRRKNVTPVLAISDTEFYHTGDPFTHVAADWFCTDCGRGPLTIASHAPSCGGTDDPELRRRPRKYGVLGG